MEMTRATTVLFSFALFAASFIGIAVWAARRTHNAMDFLIGSRRVGAWLTGLSYSVNAVNASMVIAFSAIAFSWGLAALWVWAAAVFGYLLNGFYIAPRLRLLSVSQGSVTVMQVLTADAGDRMQRLIVRSASFIVLTLLLLQTSAQLHAATTAMVERFDVGPGAAVAMATGLLALCTLAGGYWFAVMCDTVTAIALLLLALFLPLPAMLAAGGWEELRIGFAALGPEMSDLFHGRAGVVAIALAVGIFGIGLGTLGQPHAAVRFMAARDEGTLRRARWIAIAWIAIVSAAVMLCGWSAKVLYAGLANPEQAMFALATRVLPPAAGAWITLALLATIVGSLASQFLVVASSLTVDLKRPTSPLSLPWLRTALVAIAVVAAYIARFAPVDLLEYTLFSFTALGASFGALLLVRMSGKRVRPGSMLGAMWAGFSLTILFHLLPDSPGDFLERVLPFVAALGIALSGGERRRNPDRADRGQETVHDRVPI
jgi:sodium/proline symporter